MVDWCVFHILIPRQFIFDKFYFYSKHLYKDIIKRGKDILEGSQFKD